MLKQLQFNGEVVVVTGAGTGIGRAIAEAVAELGANAVLVARTQSRLERTKGIIERNGGKAAAFAADVSQEDDVRHVAALIRQREISAVPRRSSTRRQ